MGVPAGLFEIMGSLLGIGVLVLVLRWVGGDGRSLPAPLVADPLDTTGLGLLVEVSRVGTEVAADLLRDRLRRAGIRATIGRAEGGYRLLVFPVDVVDARIVLGDAAPG